MSDIDTIKARIRKLMAVAGDGIATEGEIENAMNLAAKLIDQHHISQDELQPDNKRDNEEIQFGRISGVSNTSRISTWEQVLAMAIAHLFGSVQTYCSREKTPIRRNGIVQIKGGEIKKGVRIYFYGPLVESKEAAELFEEWSRAIAAMGIARWGGAFRGDGAMYCDGFAESLFRRAKEIEKARALTTAKPIHLIGHTGTNTAITLASRYQILKNLATQHLEQNEGIKLRTRYGYGSGYKAGSNEAYNEGRQHGTKAEFGKRTSRPQLPE
jgi:hypothetical protein